MLYFIFFTVRVGDRINRVYLCAWNLFVLYVCLFVRGGINQLQLGIQLIGYSTFVIVPQLHCKDRSLWTLQVSAETLL